MKFPSRLSRGACEASCHHHRSRGRPRAHCGARALQDPAELRGTGQQGGRSAEGGLRRKCDAESEEARDTWTAGSVEADSRDLEGGGDGPWAT